MSKKTDQLIYKAIRKHLEFTFSIIEFCNESNLDEREKYWIRFYESNDLSKGYNLTDGGDVFIPNKEVIEKMINSAKNKKTVSLYSLNGNLIQTFESVRKCAKVNNITPGTVFNAIRTKNVLLKQYLVCYGDDEQIPEYSGKNTKAISQAMMNNTHCLKYKWIALVNNIKYEADSLKKLASILNIKEESLRSIAYGRNKNSEIKVIKIKI